MNVRSFTKGNILSLMCLLLFVILGVGTAFSGISILIPPMAVLFIFYLTLSKNNIEFLLLAPFVLLTFVPSNFAAQFLISTPIGNLNPAVLMVLVSMLVVGVLKKLKFDISLWKKNKEILFFNVIFLVIGLVSNFINSTGTTGMAASVYTFILGAGTFMLVIMSGMKIDTLKIMKSTIFISSIVCLLGLLELIGIQPYLEFYKIHNQQYFFDNTLTGGLPRVVSSLGNPLILSVYLLMNFVFVLYMRDTEKKKLIWNIVALLHILTIFATMSRSAMLVFVCVFSSYLLKKNKAKGFLKILLMLPIVFSLAILLMDIFDYRQLFLDRLEFKTQSESFSFRIQAFSAIKYILMNNNFLFGIGPNMVTRYLSTNAVGLISHNTLDNVYLMILAGSGMLGLISYVGLLVTISRKINHWESDIKFVGQSLLFIIFSMGFSFNVIFFDSVWGVFWFLVGLMTLHTRNHLKAKPI